MLIERARRATRWGAFSLLLWGLMSVWISLAIFWLLRNWWPAWASASGVAAVALLIYVGAVVLRRYRARRRQVDAGSPPDMPQEMIDLLERWTADQPWLAVGLAAGAGWVTARSEGDPQQTLRQILELMRGMEAARQQTRRS